MEPREARITLRPPRLILIMGVAGSGKSELAGEILARVWAVYLDNNFLADAFFPGSRTDERYLAIRENLYTALYRITEENLKIGNSVLLDAPHIRQVLDSEWCRQIEELAEKAGAWIRAIRCSCSEPVLRGRLEARGEKRDIPKIENWPSFLQEQPPRAPIPFPHLELDTEQPLKATVDQAVSYILQGA